MTSLVLAEHDNGALKDATHKTVTAACAVSTPVHVLVAGENCAGVAAAAAKIAGSLSCVCSTTLCTTR